VRLDREESHHVRRVRRLGPGDVVELLDGTGHHYLVRLETVGPDGIEGVVLASSQSLAESPLSSTLVQGIPKGEKMEWVIQKATELGVSRIIPLLTARSVAQISSVRASSKLRRWQRVAKEAAKQAGRGLIPVIEHPLRLEEFLKNPPPADLAICLWEGAKEPLASVLDRAVRPVHTALVVVGPEGGWAQAEVAMVEAHGIAPAGLGRRILRTESAALVGLALLQFRFGDLGTGPSP
jgi:16S rRNA (uracil1498-N3)-methyltransferase